VDTKRINSGDQAGQYPQSQYLGLAFEVHDQGVEIAAGSERKKRAVDSDFLDLSKNERFVKPEKVAEFLDIDKATVVRFASRGILPGHPLRVSGKRIHWRFLLSEVRAAMLPQTREKVSANVRAGAQRKAKHG
jgi:hypothetical protein